MTTLSRHFKQRSIKDLLNQQAQVATGQATAAVQRGQQRMDFMRQGQGRQPQVPPIARQVAIYIFVANADLRRLVALSQESRLHHGTHPGWRRLETELHKGFGIAAPQGQQGVFSHQ